MGLSKQLGIQLKNDLNEAKDVRIACRKLLVISMFDNGIRMLKRNIKFYLPPNYPWCTSDATECGLFGTKQFVKYRFPN